MTETMRAFQLTSAPKSKSPQVDHGYDWQMPGIRCLACRQVVSNWAFEYPAIDYDFIASSGLYGDRAVSLEEFRALQERIFQAADRRFCLVPGGLLGTPSGKAESSKLDDFAWGSVVPVISKRAVECLAQEGIRLRTGKIDLVFRGKRLDSHLSLQVEPEEILTEANRRAFTLEHCPICGDFRKIDLRPHVPQGMQIDRSRVPGEHLFKSVERAAIIASSQFIDATLKHGLTGAHFEDCGEYV